MKNIQKYWILFLLAGSLSQAAETDGRFTLYPWNLGLSAYYTRGEYSTGQDYNSNAFYLSLDRRGKDGFTIGYESLTITDTSGAFHQYNLLTRDVFYFKPEIYFGGLVGNFHSNDTDEGWLMGAQIMGALPWFGYAVSYTHSDYHSWIWNWLDPLDGENMLVDQWGIILSRRLGQHVFRLGFDRQKLESDQKDSRFLSWEWTLTSKLSFSASWMSGKSRLSVDPYLLIVDNNPDILTQRLNFRMHWRVSTHWHLFGIISQQEYNGIVNDGTYNIRYYALGVQTRF